MSDLQIESFLAKHPVLKKNEIKNHPLSDPKRIDAIWNLAQQEKDSYPFEPEFLHFLIYLRNLCKAAFHAVEGKESTSQKTWKAGAEGLHGGGVMTVLRGVTLEKSAVNMSVVGGASYPDTEQNYANKPFAAAGVSLISHPKNPYAPIMHFNVRCIQISTEPKALWIGGGADLTPMIPFEEDTTEFHNAMKDACKEHATPQEYEKYKQWAKDYFYIPHRKEERGVGGIFFDFLPIPHETQFDFLLAVGQHAIRSYVSILARRTALPYTPEQLEQHLYWRGRYAEFNLVYDRGTRFGLMGGGNYEAIFCSLPPTVKW